MRHIGGSGQDKGHLEVSTAFLMQGELSQLSKAACGLPGERSRCQHRAREGVLVGKEKVLCGPSILSVTYSVPDSILCAILWRWLRPASLSSENTLSSNIEVSSGVSFWHLSTYSTHGHLHQKSYILFVQLSETNPKTGPFGAGQSEALIFLMSYHHCSYVFTWCNRRFGVFKLLVR